MTEKELAKCLGIENDTDVAFDSRRHFHPLLLEHILHLKREYENTHFIIDDDDEIDFVAEPEEPKTIATSLAASPYQGFVGRWREQNQETGKVIPLAIHPKLAEKRSDGLTVDEMIDYFSKQGA